MSDQMNAFPKRALAAIESVGLGIIAIATVAAAGADIAHMVEAGRVALADLLLLFIYLEVLAMIGLYFESGQLPVRFPLYIAIVALARYLILDMKELEIWRLVGVSGSILLLAISVLVIRYGHVHLPYRDRRGTKRRAADAEEK